MLWNSGRNDKRYLFDLREVVIRVLVESDLSNLPKWELRMRPDLGQIENVVAELFGLLGCHGLL